MARTNKYIKKYANGNRIEEITIPAIAIALTRLRSHAGNTEHDIFR